MATATDTKAFPVSLPTSTPVLDALRPVSGRRPARLTAGEYFFVSSLVIALLTTLPRLRQWWASFSSPEVFARALVLPVAAFLMAWLIHELGHFAAAWLAGFRVSPRSTGVHGHGNILNVSDCLRVGVLSLEPRGMRNLRGRLAIIFLGGPFAGLLVAAVLEFGVNWSKAGMVLQGRVHLLSAFCVLLSLASLLPDTGHSGDFSDGARLVMLLRNDEKAARVYAVLQMQQWFAEGVHPSEWEPGLVHKAISGDDQSRDAVVGQWLGYLWAAERQDISAAAKHLEDALSAPASYSGNLGDRLYLEAAVFQAWFRDNPAKARAWAALIRRGGLTAFEQRRLEIALLWVDGRLFDAFEKMPDYFVSLKQLPESPARKLAEKSAMEWKRQMESRMLTRAWRSMYNMSQQVESSAPADTLV
ncbi:MAG: M50 family metallopeptidase [Actinomycetota bacterium]